MGTLFRNQRPDALDHGHDQHDCNDGRPDDIHAVVVIAIGDGVVAEAACAEYDALVKGVGYVDLLIPRGGKGLMMLNVEPTVKAYKAAFRGDLSECGLINMAADGDI